MSIDPLSAGILGLGLFQDDRNVKNLANAQQKATADTIADQRSSREESRNLLTGRVGNVNTALTPGPEGGPPGLSSTYVPGSSDDILNKGDVGRATELNQAGADFKLNLPSLQDANELVGRDQARTKGLFDDELNKVSLRTGQQGSPGSSNFNPNMARELSLAATRMAPNPERAALELFQSSRDSDLQGAITNQQRLRQQAKPIQGVGPSAAQVNAQIPLVPHAIDPSSASTGLATSNFLAQILQQREKSKADAQAVKLAEISGNSSDNLLRRLLRERESFNSSPNASTIGTI